MSTIVASAPDAIALSPEEIVRTLACALNEGRIDTAVALFAEGFTLRDHALDLEFNDRSGLADFFRKRRSLFPEVHCHVQSVLVAGNTAVLQWMLEGFALAATYGQREFKSPVRTSGASIVECECGKIKSWADYYDCSRAQRTPLVTYFKPFD